MLGLNSLRAMNSYEHFSESRVRHVEVFYLDLVSSDVDEFLSHFQCL